MSEDFTRKFAIVALVLTVITLIVGLVLSDMTLVYISLLVITSNALYFATYFLKKWRPSKAER